LIQRNRVAEAAALIGKEAEVVADGEHSAVDSSDARSCLLI
jgi:hypothetical protein